jgi:sugar/nucleoside kinase (ribokinase family)
MENDVYIYGMTVLSTIHQLKDKYPLPNTYQEIQNTFVMPGGEAANCAIILRNLGLNVRLDGSFFGDKTAGPLTQYFRACDIDCSNMQKEKGFEGWQDIVFCDGKNRTVFGWYVKNLFDRKRLWTIPSEESIKKSRCVALDPFFGAESKLVAELCVKHGKKYITIDYAWDSFITQKAHVIICSEEFLDRDYPGQDHKALLEKYRRTCEGMVIFTFGSNDILYTSPRHNHPETFKTYQVPVVDTLGAGDTFRAGIVYGVLNGYSQSEIVRFAAACAAIVCTRFPSVQQAPTLEEVQAFISSYISS